MYWNVSFGAEKSTYGLIWQFEINIGYKMASSALSTQRALYSVHFTIKMHSK